MGARIEQFACVQIDRRQHSAAIVQGGNAGLPARLPFLPLHPSFPFPGGAAGLCLFRSAAATSQVTTSAKVEWDQTSKGCRVTRSKLGAGTLGRPDSQRLIRP